MCARCYILRISSIRVFPSSMFVGYGGGIYIKQGKKHFKPRPLQVEVRTQILALRYTFISLYHQVSLFGNVMD